MLELKDFFIELPGFTLGPLNLRVEHKDFFAIMGPTGSGKTLLLEAIAGILPAKVKRSGGRIVLNGKDITSMPPEKRSIGIVYQDLALFPHMTVRENICFGLRYKRSVAKSGELESLVRELGIAHLMDRYPEGLSGGEKQRTALARVLVLEPDVILLDEPLSALDPLYRRDVQGLLRRLHTRLGTTFVMVSHSFSEVRFLAKSGAIISEGQIVQKGPLDEIFFSPSSSFVARFTGARNIFKIDRHEKGGCLSGLGVMLEDVPEEANRAILRAEEMEISHKPSKNNRHRIFLKGVLNRIDIHGGFGVAEIMCQDSTIEVCLGPKELETFSSRLGGPVFVSFDPKRIHFFTEPE